MHLLPYLGLVVGLSQVSTALPTPEPQLIPSTFTKPGNASSDNIGTQPHRQAFCKLALSFHTVRYDLLLPEANKFKGTRGNIECGAAFLDKMFSDHWALSDWSCLVLDGEDGREDVLLGLDLPVWVEPKEVTSLVDEVSGGEYGDLACRVEDEGNGLEGFE